MSPSDFAHRSTVNEWMDEKEVPFTVFHNCLSQLELINRCTFAYRPTLQWLSGIVRYLPSDHLTILDVGCGGGDMLMHIWHWAEKEGISVDLIGVDINPFSKQSAEKRIPTEAPIRIVTADLFSFMPANSADIIISSLFTHHLDDKALQHFIRWMEMHAKRGWLISDLHRHPIPYYFIKGVTRCLPAVNPLIRHDAPVSVARAFTKANWATSLAAAGLTQTHCSITWHMPFRYLITRWK
ncbi:MAG: methyltransferase domain-containing protein [Methylobacter sp.]